MRTNFPVNLNIYPSQPSEDAPEVETFNFANQQEAIRLFGIAGRIWEAAYVLNSYIKPSGRVYEPPLFPETRNPVRIIELGSGSGVVAATMADVLDRTRDIIFATDLPEVCPLLEQNLEAHLHDANRGPIFVRPLSWGNSQHAVSITEELSNPATTHDFPHLTHIICSDLVYFPELLAPLLRSLIQLSSPPFVVEPSDVRVIISYKIRSLAKETPFWSAFGLWFEFTPVLVQKTDLRHVSPLHRLGSDLEDPTFVFVARRREQSFHWNVPPNDEDLMHSGDDTFETLLLMSLDEQ
ncbi:putative methyltransferase-domain-containing protein [Mycena maculata]|uniref:Methyltransferase-domain-containing protein n=1 Tax=Mycena maculata TaxID=230809 RepID=A0AAD7NH21_9AGAR|nr:putative methyltransferase-domain-containing protein [Mycena maculata]